MQLMANQILDTRYYSEKANKNSNIQNTGNMFLF
jgi:hypothetical protein